MKAGMQPFSSVSIIRSRMEICRAKKKKQTKNLVLQLKFIPDQSIIVLKTKNETYSSMNTCTNSENEH